MEERLGWLPLELARRSSQLREVGEMGDAYAQKSRNKLLADQSDILTNHTKQKNTN